MKVLIFEIWHVSPQFETGLELAEKHLRNGDEVFYVNIGGRLPYIEWYRLPENKLIRKLYQLSVDLKLKCARSLIKAKNIKFSSKLLINKVEIDSLYENLMFNNLDELKKYKWEGIDIGMATASSHITDTNNLNPDTIKESAQINKIILSSKIVARSFQKWLNFTQPDLVLFRNGRVANYRPILRICQRTGQDFLVHDRACDKNHYSLGPTYRHDWNMRKREMDDLWHNTTGDEKFEIGRLFFEERKNRADDSHVIFAKDQKHGLLPDTWKKGNYNVVFFNSSISEYAAVGDEVNPHILFPTQEVAIKHIEKILSERGNSKFYLRLHPNLLNQSQEEKNIWLGMGSANVEIIPPDSPIDTYTLIEDADLVICYLSTVGIEAAYSRTPVIILGRALYEDLDVTYNPGTLEELNSLLMRDKLEPKDATNAIRYGFYMKTHGEPYIHFSADDHRSGKYRGKNIQMYDLKKNLKPMIRLKKSIVNSLKRR